MRPLIVAVEISSAVSAETEKPSENSEGFSNGYYDFLVGAEENDHKRKEDE